MGWPFGSIPLALEPRRKLVRGGFLIRRDASVLAADTYNISFSCLLGLSHVKPVEISSLVYIPNVLRTNIPYRSNCLNEAL